MSKRSLMTACALAFFVLGTAWQVKAEQIVAFNTQNRLVVFDSATPGSVNVSGQISGLRSGEALVGIDLRPATGELYGLGDQGGIYTITTAGVATFQRELVGAAAGMPGAGFMGLNGESFGIDFNPAVDRLRVVTEGNQNLRINVDTGVALVDSDLAFAPGTFPGVDPTIVSVAYEPNVAGVPVELYGIDTSLNRLFELDPPNSGTLVDIGALGVDPSSNLSGFDVSGATNVGYASFTVVGARFSQLYTINLDTGLATLVGTIGGNASIRGLSIVPAAVPEPATMLLLGTGLAGIAAKIRKRRKGNQSDKV